MDKNLISYETVQGLLSDGIDSKLDDLSNELKGYTDKNISKAKLAVQKWLPAVNEKTDLPTSYGTNMKKGFTYLCRVLTGADADKVFQMIPDNNGEFTSWVEYAINKNWVDPEELSIRTGFPYDDATTISGHIHNMQQALESRIVPVETAINDPASALNTNISNIKGSILTLNGKVNTLNTDVAGLKTDTQGLQTQVTNLNSTTSTLNTQIGGLQTQVADLGNTCMKKAMFDLQGTTLTITTV